MSTRQSQQLPWQCPDTSWTHFTFYVIRVLVFISPMCIVSSWREVMFEF
jgi:hypothetical protein